MVVGFLINVVSTALHPSGEEDDHRAISTEYADSDAWRCGSRRSVHRRPRLGGLLVLRLVPGVLGGAALLAGVFSVVIGVDERRRGRQLRREAPQ
jgi:hypothetical protein